MVKSGVMPSLTNVWIPEAQKEPFGKAAEYYQFESMSAYFRMCAALLIEHYEHKDIINTPFKFETNKKG